MRLPLEKQIRVVISSDVKNEADDQYAIVHQLLTPLFDVRGVIAAHFESKAPGSETTMEKSYQELLRLMKAIDIDDVPALRGSTAPLKDEEDAPESKGVDFLIREALRDDPRPLYVTCQCTLTDVAAALNRCPEIAEKLTVVWIGAPPEGRSSISYRTFPRPGPSWPPGPLSGSCRSTCTAPWRSVLRSSPPGSAPAAR